MQKSPTACSPLFKHAWAELASVKKWIMNEGWGQTEMWSKQMVWSHKSYPVTRQRLAIEMRRVACIFEVCISTRGNSWKTREMQLQKAVQSRCRSGGPHTRWPNKSVGYQTWPQADVVEKLHMREMTGSRYEVRWPIRLLGKIVCMYKYGSSHSHEPSQTQVKSTPWFRPWREAETYGHWGQE